MAAWEASWYDIPENDERVGITREDATMNAEGVIRILDEHREELRRLGVAAAGLVRIDGPK